MGPDPAGPLSLAHGAAEAFTGAAYDFAWLRHRLVVEFDGFATHGRRQAFTPDRKRGADLTARAGALAVREAA